VSIRLRLTLWQTLLLGLVLDVYQQGRALADGVRLELGEWEQVAVDGDPDRLKQVALNLLDNALRHTPTGGVVTLGLLRVRDTGLGIASEHLPRIFERFYRVDQPRSRRASGTGRGLAITREVAEAHGGRIEVASRPGHGAAFSSFPRQHRRPPPRCLWPAARPEPRRKRLPPPNAPLPRP
jgi:two-component system sensor histidine kinase BaeS